LSADGHVRVGSSSQDHLTGTADSLLVSRKFEVDSTAYFDNGVEIYGQTIIYNATNSRFQFYETAVGSGLVAEMRYDTDQALLAVGAPLGRQIIVSDAANYTKDYDHAVQTNPTFYVHSATDPDSANDEWWSIAHDVTDAVYSVGSGVHKFTGDMLSHGSAKHYFDAGAAAGTEWAGSLADTYFDLAHGAGGGLRIRDENNLLVTLSRFSAAAPTILKLTATQGFYFYRGGTQLANFDVNASIFLNAKYFKYLWIDGGDGAGDYTHSLILGDGADTETYYDGTNLIIDPDRVGSGKVYIGATADDEAAAAKWHTTVAGTEYAGSDAAGYYDIHALTAARFNTDIFVADAKNFILDTTTGSELGTAANQKLGHWGATPVVQPAHIADPALTIAGNNAAIIAILAQMAATGMQAAA